MSNEQEWRWADPSGQQRLVRLDELRAALASGAIPSNAPVWQAGWPEWRPAEEVPELQSSALSAHNGVLPNIPPPPAFVVAAQTNFEGASAQGPAQVVREPPAPPKYTPAVVVQRAPPVARIPTGSPKPSPVRAQESKPKQPIATKPAFAKPPPPQTKPKSVRPPPPPAVVKHKDYDPLPPEAPTTPDLGWDELSVPQDANTAVNEAITEARAKAALEHAALPTMIGVPALKKDARRVITPVNMPAPPPRTLPPKAMQYTPEPSPPPPPPAPQKPQSIPPPKRPTLMLYGGAPGDARDSSVGEPSAPIVVPPPEPSGATRNMVTRPPPWSEGAAEMPAMPRHASPPRALPEAAEELSGSLLLSDSGSSDAHRSQELSSSDLNSESSVQVVKPPPLTPSLPVTMQRPHGTMMGMAPPPPPLEVPPNVRSSPPPERPASPPPQDSHARLHDLQAILRERPKWQLAVVGGVGLLVMLGTFGLLIKAISGGSGDDKAVASASASAIATMSARVTSPTQTQPIVTAPPHVGALSVPTCTTAGDAHVIAPKAVVGSGVEVHANASGLTLGFATTPKDAMVIAIDPSSMAAASSSKPHVFEALKRVQAGPTDKLSAVLDFDKKGDALQGRRSLVGALRIDVGGQDGTLAWAPAGTDNATKLFDLPSKDPVEALRGDKIPSGGFVIAARQGKAVVFGAIVGEPLAPKGSLTTVLANGTQVGSPSVATNDSVALVVWAEKSDSWAVRLSRMALGQAPDAAIAFDLPAGGLGEQALSPSVAALPGGAFLLVWTEGPTSNHQVRAMVLDDHGKPAGKAFTVSEAGVNAGQGQAAVLADGKGVVAFLASAPQKTFQVVAIPIECISK